MEISVDDIVTLAGTAFSVGVEVTETLELITNTPDISPMLKYAVLPNEYIIWVLTFCGDIVFAGKA